MTQVAGRDRAANFSNMDTLPKFRDDRPTGKAHKLYSEMLSAPNEANTHAAVSALESDSWQPVGRRLPHVTPGDQAWTRWQQF